MAPLLPIGVAALGGFTWWRVRRRKYGQFTEQRKKIFEAALNPKTEIKDPAKLEALAKAFEKEGLGAQAEELRKRAKLKAAPAAVKQKYDETFRKALGSTDPQKVNAVSQAFHKIGAYGAAEKLRKYAINLSPSAARPSPVRPAAPPMPQAAYGDAPLGPGGIPPKTAKVAKPKTPSGAPLSAIARATAALARK